MDALNSFLETLVSYVWGLPMVFLLLGCGLFFTVSLGFPQIRYFGHAISVLRGRYDNPDDPGEIHHFKALCAALSGTVGLGNIAGVAVAIKMGGPGATVWMIIAGLLGMATKFAECALAVRFRRIGENGEVHGGAMHYIELGLGPKFKFLSYFFAICCVLGSLGAANMFQANQVAAILNSSFSVPTWVTGALLGVFTGIVIIGGIKRIGTVAAVLVPAMGLGYVGGCLVIIGIHWADIPDVISQIISSAINGTAAAGGFAGAAVKEVLIQGMRRAVFSNEAGLGTAPIAHAAAKTNEPIREGVVALLEPFIDTVVICTMTAMVINVTGAWQGPLNGVELTAAAMDSTLPGFGSYFIPIAVLCFAFSTLISWSYYGERATEYLFGTRGILPYKFIFCCFCFVGATWTLGPVLNFSDSALGLMVVPNIIAVLFLSGRIRKADKEYRGRLARGEFKVYK